MNALDKYLIDNDLSALDFGKRIGLTQPNSIYRYLRGERVPKPELMVAIYRETGGVVDPNSFYDLPDLPAGVADLI